MIYKFNKVEIDSKWGSPNLSIPSGPIIPVRPGDMIEYGKNRFIVPLPGKVFIDENTSDIHFLENKPFLKCYNEE